jgi:hypothetical protein
MGEPGRPETGSYSDVIEAYQRVIRQEWTDGDAELLEEILPIEAVGNRESFIGHE